jgi:AcrR family transcriptional regulator
MARTQAADYDQRKLAIVDAAAELYARKGFLGTSLLELAERCGYSKSLIYHYYSSKEDILFDVMADHVETLTEAAEQVLREAPASPAERLKALTHAFMGNYVGAADRHKVLLNELEQLPAERRGVIVAHQRRLISIVEALLIELQPKLRRKRKLLRPTAMIYFGMINWTHTWFRADGPATADQIADLVADIVLKGLPET